MHRYAVTPPPLGHNRLKARTLQVIKGSHDLANVPDDGSLPTSIICHQIEAVVRIASHATNTVNLSEQSFSFF